MDLDLTLLIQLGIFCLVLVTLNTILLKPFIGVIEDRQRKIQGAREEAERLQAQTRGHVETYESRLHEAKRDAQREREALRNRGREEERRMLAEVRADIARQLNEAREQVGAAEQDAKAALAPQKQELAEQLIEKVLGRKVAA